MTRKFSILIPAYNVEKYINKCLSSIKEQAFSNYEVIIINDGSTDRTLDICKEYEKSDNRFIVYHQTNRGIAYTRNRLLELAKGEWIVFVDADDYVNSDFLLAFYECLNRNDNADVLISDYTSWNNENVFTPYKETFKNKIDYLQKLLGWRMANTSLWAKAIRRSLILKHNFKFEKDITLGEDLCFVSRLFYYADNIIHTPSNTYIWNRTNADSITRKGIFWGDYILLYETIASFYKSKKDYQCYKKTLSNTIVRAIETTYLYSYKTDFGQLPYYVYNEDLTISNKIRFFLSMNNCYKLASFYDKITKHLKLH